MDELESLLTSKRWARWLFAFLCWVAVVLLFSFRVPAHGKAFPWSIALKVSAGSWFVWAFFLPAIAIVDRVIMKRAPSLVQRLLLHVPVSLCVSILTVYLYDLVDKVLWNELRSFRLSFHVLWASRTGVFYNHFLIYWGILGLYIAWDSHNRLKDRIIKTTELERALVEARLGVLQTQLNPHFLFNALNAISAHVEGTPRTARRMLEQLGDLLRMSLSHLDDQEITLAEEMAFIGKYINLQEARFGDRLRVETRIDPAALEAFVPTFLLEPLVENAIRHGLSPLPEGGALMVKCVKNGERLQLAVQDNGVGLPDGWDAEDRGGIGLRNTRERLGHLYGSDHRFTITGKPGEGVLIDIDIPYRLMSNAGVQP